MVTPVVMSDASADTEMLHAMKNSFTLPIGASSGHISYPYLVQNLQEKIP